MSDKHTTAAPANRGFDKIEHDLGFLMQEFTDMLARVGDADLIPLLPWHGEREPTAKEFSPHLTQAYSVCFQLLNMVEENTANQIRRRHETRKGLNVWNGLWGSHIETLAQNGFSEDDIAKAIGRIRIEPVLTAHPTESKRITILELQREMYLSLVQRENQMWTPSEAEDIAQRVNSMLERLWRTGEIYQTKPTVESERWGMEYYLTQIFPIALQKLDKRLWHAWKHQGFDPEKLARAETRPHLYFGTWVGGDRDGHPFVTPKVTEETLISFRLKALALQKRTLETLRARISLSDHLQAPPEKLIDGIARLWDILGDRAAAIAKRNDGESWRQFLTLMIARMPITEQASEGTTELATNYFTSYRYPTELRDDLALLRDSLLEVGATGIVEEEVEPAIRLCDTFGFHLASLDIRQNSGLHDRAISQILKHLGHKDTDFANWPEDRRIAFLDEELRSHKKRLRRFDSPGEDADTAVRAYATIARYTERYGPDGIGALVLSMTRSLSDLLAVYFLAREAGLLRVDEYDTPVCPIPVVPLFETVDDLQRAPGIMDRFLSHPVSRASLRWMHTHNSRQACPQSSKPVQQVMIGYSDSNKDKGILASQWALHRAQNDIARIARRHNTRIRFFHGRGGTISRGAGPTDRFLEALPEDTLHYDLRMTEQGEVIAQKFANLLTATYNLELLASGACRFSLLPGKPSPLKENLAPVFDELAHISGEAYQAFLKKDRFIDFYRQVTPIDALEHSRIGSRPSRRTGAHTLEDLRAIPWVFSWSQARFFLPGWYGAGTALNHFRETKPEQFEEIKKSAPELPFLNYMLTNIEASLLSAEPDIMRRYATLVTDESLRQDYMWLIIEEYHRTADLLSDLLGGPIQKRRPNFANTIARRSTALRVLHEQQISLLALWRQAQNDNDHAAAEHHLQNLLLTVNAIAGGLKTTG